MYSETTHANITYQTTIQCRCCKGKGYQCRDDGIYVICPCCNGEGYNKQKCEPTPYYPLHEPYSPWYPMPWHDQPTYEPQRWKYEVTC